MTRATHPVAQWAWPLVAILALGGCSQDEAPSETVQQAMEETIDAAQGNAAPAAMARGPYAPRDDCAGAPGATDFRRSLAAAVAARDADALVALAASDIKLDFGGGSGTAELRRRLADADLWGELAAILEMGCARDGDGGITLPWYVHQDLGPVDRASGMIVTGEGVPVFAGPQPGARQIGTVSWNVVSLVGGLQPGNRAQQVRLPNGALGYIASGRLRSLIDYRLTAISRNGQWRIVSLLAGD